MPRRKMIEKRPISPDSRFNSVLVTKFVNGIMEQGKKTIAHNIFYGAMDIIEQRIDLGILHGIQHQRVGRVISDDFYLKCHHRIMGIDLDRCHFNLTFGISCL